MKKLTHLMLLFLFSESIIFAQPVIKSFTPESGPIGTKVTITGANFGVKPSDNIVYFGSVKAVVSEAAGTSLIVSVPAGADYKPITVTTKNLTAYSAKPFIVSFIGDTNGLTKNSFAFKIDFKTSENPSGIASGDLDGDGKPDLAVVNSGSKSVSLYRNTGTKGKISFDTKIDYPTNLIPLILDIGDLDGDGKPDMAVTNRDSYSVLIFRNTGSIGAISFDTAIGYTTGDKPYFVSIGDIDGDGKPDLAVANYGVNTVSVLRNTSSPGNISFDSKVDYTVGNAPFCVSIGDLDGDGKADLVVTNSDDSTFSVLKNLSIPGTVSFAPKSDFITGHNPEVVSIGDLDGDGKPDLAIANKMEHTVSIFKNTAKNGIISFASKVKYMVGNKPWSIEINDMDGDGKPDLAVSNKNSNCVLVYKNSCLPGTILFTNKVVYPTGENPNQAVIVDLDADGKADIAVTNFHGSSFSVFRNQINELRISSFAPIQGKTGTIITISGANFTGTTAVSFGNTAASSFTVVSPTEISAIVGTGSQGNLTLTSPEGTASLEGFNYYTTPPTIKSFFPASAIKGTTVVITGTKFSDATAVSFGKTPASSFTVVSPTEISAVVGEGSSGSVSVTTPDGTITRGGFTFGLPPEITMINPPLGNYGTTVKITGKNFTGATEVRFGGMPADTFSVVSSTEISAVVGSSGATGSVSVSTPSGVGSFSAFSYIAVPTITSFAPTSGIESTIVTITGTNLTKTTAVRFGETPAASYTVISPTTVLAVVGSGSTGKISVTTTGLTASIGGFIYGPIITNFKPASAASGTIITIKGVNLNGLTSVSFGGTPAASFNIVSSTELTAIVGQGSSGIVTLSTKYGTTSLEGFTYIK